MRRGKDRTADSAGTVDDPGDGCGPFLPEDGRNRAHHKAERHRTGAASDQQPVNQNQHPDMSTKRRQKESPAEHQRTDRQNAGICPFQCQRSEYRLGHAVKKLRQRNGKAYRCRIKACCVLNCRRDQPEIDPDTTVQCTDQAANKCNEYDTSCTVLLFLLNFTLHRVSPVLYLQQLLTDPQQRRCVLFSQHCSYAFLSRLPEGNRLTQGFPALIREREDLAPPTCFLYETSGFQNLRITYHRCTLNSGLLGPSGQISAAHTLKIAQKAELCRV